MSSPLTTRVRHVRHISRELAAFLLFVCGGGGAQAPGLKILKRLQYLGSGVHDERPGHGHWFANWFAAQQEYLEG